MRGSSKGNGEQKQVSDPTGYVPPARVLKRIIKRETDAAGKEIVSMPAEAFNKLLAAALSAGFDEESYLDRHPDVRRKVAEEAIPSGLSHFATYGYFEDRSGFDLAVDAKWYQTAYPDVASAIKNQQITDARGHFMLFGYAEGRNPGPAFQRIVGEWNRIARSEQS
jgi:hypothetical protein